MRNPEITSDNDNDHDNDNPELDGPAPFDGERPAPEPVMGMAEICVPVSALAMPDEGDKMQNPRPGDSLQGTWEGKLSRIEGDNAYVSLTAVNDEKLDKPQDDFGELQSMAAQMPEPQ